MSGPVADLGLIGLAVMGQNLILNMADNGFTICAFNRTVSKVDRFLENEAKGKSVVGAHSVEEFVSKLKSPRRVMLLVQAGQAVDDWIEKILPLLDAGDIIIDGGNSHFPDSNRRTKYLAGKNIRFVGSGVSGGEEGARYGPSLMPGGNEEAWPHIKDIFQSIAAKSDGEACCEWVGDEGAGHYVKMVHNGIEYGDMQLICEAYDIMKRGLGLSSKEIGDVLAKWNKGVLDSFLIEITRDIMYFNDDDGTALVEKILDKAGQKGTGKWTAVNALDLGQPVTLIAEAVLARCLSAIKDERATASTKLEFVSRTTKFEGDKEQFLEDLEQALYASKIISYAQGFMLMQEAAREFNWKLNKPSIALMWRGGCIIRSVFLKDITHAYREQPELQNLLFDDFFNKAIHKAQPGWRDVVSKAALLGIPRIPLLCCLTAVAKRQNTMNEKESPGATPPTYDEKGASVPETNQVEETARRQSVALNIVENPLRRVSKEQNVDDAKAFAELRGMAEHAALFGRAALVARDPDRFEMVTELDEEERTALAYERDHKWHGPFMLWYSIGLCAVGAATQGWDQTGSNGANLTFHQEFGIDGPGRDEWIVGIINAIIFLTAGLIGAFIVDPLNHYFGRRGEIFITALCLTATPIGSGFAKSWQGLFAARFVMGIGIGAKNATVPIYSAEMAPARVRGALVMFWQLWVVAGIFLGFCANVIVKDTGDISWRLQLGSAFIPSFILGAGIYFCPESPRWLMKHGHYAKGFRSMVRLRAHPIIAARDYYYSYVIYQEELKEARGAGYFSRLWDCFAVPRIRRANYGASTVMIAQQMCGINIISFYSSTIFRNVGYSEDEALYASLGYGAIQVIFTIPTVFLIDTKGRRTLCLITFPLMCIFLLAGGLSLLNDSGSRGEQIGPVVLFVYLFTICYSLGEGPVAFQYSAEVFPTIQREQGMAWAVCINNTFAGVLSLTFPRMQTVMTPTGAFGFYAGLNLIAWFMIFCFVRETKQLTLEELDQVFSIPTKTFLNYELTTWLPYFFKRHILRQGIPKPPPIIEKAGRADDIASA